MHLQKHRVHYFCCLHTKKYIFNQELRICALHKMVNILLFLRRAVYNVPPQIEGRGLEKGAKRQIAWLIAAFQHLI